MVNKKDFDELKEFITDRFAEQNVAIQELTKKYEELINENRKIREEQEQRITILEAELQTEKGKASAANEKVKKMESQLADTEEQILSVDAYHRRENLRFHGVKNLKSPEESVRAFLVSSLKMDQDKVGKIEFQRIHKVGKPLVGPQDTRPILARFLRYQDVQDIKDAAKKKPKGMPGGVQEDLPSKWAQKRKFLHDNFLKPARNLNIELTVKWFRDKLSINDNTVDPNSPWSEFKKLLIKD